MSHHTPQQLQRHLVPVVSADAPHGPHRQHVGHGSSIIRTGRSLSSAEPPPPRDRALSLQDQRRQSAVAIARSRPSLPVGYPSPVYQFPARGGVRRSSMVQLARALCCCHGLPWCGAGGGRCGMAPRGARYYVAYVWVALAAALVALVVRYGVYDEVRSVRVGSPYGEQVVVPSSARTPAGYNLFCSLIQLAPQHAFPPYAAYKLRGATAPQLDGAPRRDHVEVVDEGVGTRWVSRGAFQLLPGSRVDTSVCCGAAPGTPAASVRMYVVSGEWRQCLRAGSSTPCDGHHGVRIVSEDTVQCEVSTSCDSPVDHRVTITDWHHHRGGRRGDLYDVVFVRGAGDSADAVGNVTISATIDVSRTTYNLSAASGTILDKCHGVGGGSPCHFYLSPFHRDNLLLDIDTYIAHSDRGSHNTGRGLPVLSIRCREARLEVYLLLFCVVPVLLMACVHVMLVYHRYRWNRPVNAPPHKLTDASLSLMVGDAAGSKGEQPARITVRDTTRAAAGAAPATISLNSYQQQQDKDNDDDVLYSKAKLLSLETSMDNFSV